MGRLVKLELGTLKVIKMSMVVKKGSKINDLNLLQGSIVTCDLDCQTRI